MTHEVWKRKKERKKMPCFSEHGRIFGIDLFDLS